MFPNAIHPPNDLFPEQFRLTATTTGASETVTLTTLAVSSPTRISWGDGTSEMLPANSTTALNHVYASAGKYQIIVADAKKITQLQLDNAKIGGLNTADLRYSPITSFYVTLIIDSNIRSSDMTAWIPTSWRLFAMPSGTYSISSADMTAWRPMSWSLSSMSAGTYSISSTDMTAWRPMSWYLSSMSAGTYSISSTDMTAWRPAYWYLFSMPSGTYSISSTDMTAWLPTNWYLYSMPSGTYSISSTDMTAWRPMSWYLSSMSAGTYSISSTDMTAWRPTYWRLYSMPAAGSSYTFAASCMRNWTTISTIQMNDLGLAASVIDTILADLYAGRMGFTNAAPTANLSGSNADPNGTYQAQVPPTTGMECKYELTNDSASQGFNLWGIST